jgi:uncharacterized protein YgbK (DUF1537 family)
MPKTCLLIADDLTGACDAGVYFSMAGYRTLAVLDPQDDSPEFDVLAVSTESRHLSVEALPALMRDLAAQVPVAGAILFKKIDSTLRGNAGAEIAAAMGAFGCDLALVTPAFPGMGRVVEGGCLRIRGRPEFAAIDLAEHFRNESVRDCAHVAAAELEEAIASGASFVSADAACDEDLDRIVSAGLGCKRRVLWAGSAGLAAALARALPVRESAAFAPRGAQTAALFCIGSDHSVTLEQQTHLVASRPARLLFAQSAAPDCVASTLAAGEHAVLRIPRGEVPAARIRELLVGTRQFAAAVVLSGGDTASLVFGALAMRGIGLCGEIAVGIPHAIVRGGPFDGCAVATKSGGFGAPDALISVADFFTCLKP